jgi:hypothetical protein
LIMPNTYGVPVALLGVPNASALPVPAADPLAVAAALDEPLAVGVLELLEQPAAVSAAAATDATASHLYRLIQCFFPGYGVCLRLLASALRLRASGDQAAVSPR